MTRGIMNDKSIIAAAADGMISPYVETITRVDPQTGTKMISYGVSSFGYDIRLSGLDFRIFKPENAKGPINPKAFDENCLEKAEMHFSEWGAYFIIPANSYALGVSLESIKVPESVTVMCIGKSTYARCGVIANVTPLEAGWEGHITLEFSNSSPQDVMIFANEGVLQLIFFEGEQPETPYNKRAGGGKYQSQRLEVTTARV